jgi:hypothetical protein
MSVHLKIEGAREGFVATLSQRDDMGKALSHPSVFPVSSKEAAKQQAKTLARSLGLKAYGFIDKTSAGDAPSPPQQDPGEARSSDTDYTNAGEARPPWRVPGVEKSL